MPRSSPGVNPDGPRGRAVPGAVTPPGLERPMALPILRPEPCAPPVVVRRRDDPGSSPGIDRPLTARRHFARARGRRVRIALADGREVSGRLRDVDDAGLAAVLRGGRGLRHRPSRAPEKPLELWSFEGSPFSRLVRERLTELELPYTLHNLAKEHWKELGPATRRIAPNPYVPREGGKRFAFYQEHGRVQVPYLEDPNTGAALFESAKIGSTRLAVCSAHSYG